MDDLEPILPLADEDEILMQRAVRYLEMINSLCDIAKVLLRDGVIDYRRIDNARDANVWRMVRDTLVDFARDGYRHFATTDDIKRRMSSRIGVANLLAPGVLDAIIALAWDRHVKGCVYFLEQGVEPDQPEHRARKIGGPKTYAEQIGFAPKTNVGKANRREEALW